MEAKHRYHLQSIDRWMPLYTYTSLVCNSKPTTIEEGFHFLLDKLLDHPSYHANSQMTLNVYIKKQFLYSNKRATSGSYCILL